MRWSVEDGGGPVTVEVCDGVATLRAGGAETSADAERFSRGAFLHEASRHFSVAVCAEVLACLRHGHLPACESPTGRASVPRVLGFGPRGSRAPGVWIFGRTVRLSSWEGDDLTFARVLADGLPQDATLPEALREKVLDAARRLAPLPCLCGTGAETPSQHGQLETLAGPLQHPHAPIEHTATVARCLVCARCWVFERAGDSHYSFRCSVRPFVGPAAEA